MNMLRGLATLAATATLLAGGASMANAATVTVGPDNSAPPGQQSPFGNVVSPDARVTAGQFIYIYFNRDEQRQMLDAYGTGGPSAALALCAFVPSPGNVACAALGTYGLINTISALNDAKSQFCEEVEVKFTYPIIVPPFFVGATPVGCWT